MSMTHDRAPLKAEKEQKQESNVENTSASLGLNGRED